MRFGENHSFEGICSVSPWPSYDEAMCRDAEIDMAVQVNGKLRGAIHVEADSRTMQSLPPPKPMRRWPASWKSRADGL